jgi:hypothetical protein
VKKSFLAGNLQLVNSCRCGKIVPNVARVIEKNSCLLMLPEVYYGGLEYGVTGFRKTDHKMLLEEFNALRPLEIVQKNVVPERK